MEVLTPTMLDKEPVRIKSYRSPGYDPSIAHGEQLFGAIGYDYILIYYVPLNKQFPKPLK